MGVLIRTVRHFDAEYFADAMKKPENANALYGIHLIVVVVMKSYPFDSELDGTFASSLAWLRSIVHGN